MEKMMKENDLEKAKDKVSHYYKLKQLAAVLKAFEVFEAGCQENGVSKVKGDTYYRVLDALADAAKDIVSSFES
jgi:hypothetical protein